MFWGIRERLAESFWASFADYRDRSRNRWRQRGSGNLVGTWNTDYHTCFLCDKGGHWFKYCPKNQNQPDQMSNFYVGRRRWRNSRRRGGVKWNSCNWSRHPFPLWQEGIVGKRLFEKRHQSENHRDTRGWITRTAARARQTGRGWFHLERESEGGTEKHKQASSNEDYVTPVCMITE